MPGISGNAAVYKLRSNGYRGRVLTLSATPTADARAAALAAGADAFVTKPIDVPAFNRLVNA
jgi:DNA-binding response OmpR family regulator